jgi:uncharacterized integral membrane protein
MVAPWSTGLGTFPSSPASRMNRIKIILLVLLSAGVGAVVIQNRAMVTIQLLVTHFEVSLILLLGLAVLAGFVLGLLVAALSKSRPDRTD